MFCKHVAVCQPRSSDDMYVMLLLAVSVWHLPTHTGGLLVSQTQEAGVIVHSPFYPMAVLWNYSLFTLRKHCSPLIFNDYNMNMDRSVLVSNTRILCIFLDDLYWDGIIFNWKALEKAAYRLYHSLAVLWFLWINLSFLNFHVGNVRNVNVEILL